MGRPHSDNQHQGEEGNHPFFPPETDEVETMPPAQRRDPLEGLLDFYAAPFDLYDPFRDERTEVSFEHPEPDMALVIDPRRESPQSWGARRLEAERAYRHGEYRGNIRLARHNDLVRHQAMEYFSNWTPYRRGSGMMYDLTDRLLYVRKDLENREARAYFNVGQVPFIYKDRNGLLHFVTPHDEEHPGAFSSSDPDSEYRRNVLHLI